MSNSERERFVREEEERAWVEYNRKMLRALLVEALRGKDGTYHTAAWVAAHCDGVPGH